MAELKSQQETTTFPSKRKPDNPNPQDPPIKGLKLSTLDHSNNEAQQQEEANLNSSENHADSEPPTTKEKTETDAVQVEEDGNDGNELQNDVVDDDKEDNDNDDDDDAEEEEEEEEEESNGEAEVDRKGKGVLRDDKGKGKLIVEDDDEDDDDDSDGDDDDDDEDEDGGVSGGDSDLSDDPLAEVDLNNILPSRTRRRTFHPGVHIASDAGNVADDDDDDDDDSDA